MDHHQVEYRYRKKSATEEAFVSCARILPDDGQYVWPKHVVENKIRTYIVEVFCLCGLSLLVTHNTA
jgi:hypothetical protein